IEAQSFGRAGVEGGEDAGLAIRGDFGYLLETGLAQHLHGELTTLIHAAVLCGNRRLANPGLKTLQGFVMPFCHFSTNGSQFFLPCGGRKSRINSARGYPLWQSKHGGACGSACEEAAAVEREGCRQA